MTSVYDAHDDYASSSSASRPVSSYSHHDDGDDEDPWAVPQQQSMRHSWAPPPEEDDDGDSEPEQEPQRRRESSGSTVVGKKQASPPQASPPTPTSPLSEAAPSSPPTTSRDPWNRGSEAQGVRSPTHGLTTTNSTFRGGFTDVNGSGNAVASPTLPPAVATPWDGQRISVRLRPELEGFVFKHNAYNVRRTAVLPPQAQSSGAASCDALLSQARNRRGAAAANGNRNGATAASLSALPQPEAPSSPSSCVVRRYSDFVWLHDVLLRRWPLRLIPPLPPKRLGMPLVAGAASLGGSAADDAFIQRRARGLERYLAALMTHPIVSHDAHLAVFLSDKGSIADWRAGHSNTNIVEETMDPRSPSNVNGSRLQQHQAVPKGFDDATGGKSLDALTNKVVPELLDKWTNLTNVVERMARRHEAQARDSDALAGLIEDVNVSSRSGASWAWLGGRRGSNDEGQPSTADGAQPAATKRIASLHRDLSSLSLLRARQTLGAREQADQSRSQDSSSRDSNDDSATVSPTLPLLERFKMTRDLFLGLRSLLSRHASLAKQLDDEVSTLKARIKAGNARLESLRLGNATAATSAEAAREEATKLHEALRRDASRADEVAVRRERARRALWDEVGLVRLRCTEPAIAAVWAGTGTGVAGVDAGTSWLEDERKLRGAERLAVEECWRDLRLRDG